MVCFGVFEVSFLVDDLVEHGGGDAADVECVDVVQEVLV